MIYTQLWMNISVFDVLSDSNCGTRARSFPSSFIFWKTKVLRILPRIWPCSGQHSRKTLCHRIGRVGSPWYVFLRSSQFRSAVDRRTEIPPQGLLPYRYRRKTPYIYDDEEISRLLKAASHLQSATALRASTYTTLFGLLASTGMRISEPIALDCKDVDLTQAILTVRWTKFGKTRLIPIHSSTVGKLEEYSRLRSRIFIRPKSPSFFVSERGTRLTQCSVRYTFVKLSREIGLRAPHDSHGPRVHDMRHTFAVKTLLRWYQTGVDVERHMPELATYLGHTHVNDTYWYISAVPELLSLATMRLDTIEGGSLS